VSATTQGPKPSLSYTKCASTSQDLGWWRGRVGGDGGSGAPTQRHETNKAFARLPSDAEMQTAKPTLDDDRGGVLSPVEALPGDDHVSVVVLPPGQTAFLCEALYVGQHRGLVLGGARNGADLFEEPPEGLNGTFQGRPREGRQGTLRCSLFLLVTSFSVDAHLLPWMLASTTSSRFSGPKLCDSLSTNRVALADHSHIPRTNFRLPSTNEILWISNQSSEILFNSTVAIHNDG